MSKTDDELKKIDDMLQKYFRGFAARRYSSDRDVLNDYNKCVENAKQALKAYIEEHYVPKWGDDNE